ncbi:MAG TPA: LegC family aminotransferase [Chitinophagaceae bacterium]
MIPLSVPNLSGNEWTYIRECLDTNWVSSVGRHVTLFEEQVARFCGVRKAIAVSNGTAALHISLLTAGVGRGDLVLLPNITFVAPANAIKYLGADPVLIDADADTWQMDAGLLEDFFTTQTRLSGEDCIHVQSGRRIAAILPVHVLGNIGDMDTIIALAKKYSVAVVEDSTEALGSYYHGRHAGTFGKLGCLSFNGNKIITTGGGGMVLCDDETLAARIRHLTTQAKADPAEYYHDEIGFNYRLVNILAAMGIAQMEQLPAFLTRKAEIREAYDEFFDRIPGTKRQLVKDGVVANNWLYTVSIPEQPALRKYLSGHQVEVRPLWVPMNRLPAFSADTYISNNDVSEKLYQSCLSLPCSTGLTAADQETVINLLQKFYHD